jgi:hypothetical protein
MEQNAIVMGAAKVFEQTCELKQEATSPVVDGIPPFDGRNENLLAVWQPTLHGRPSRSLLIGIMIALQADSYSLRT